MTGNSFEKQVSDYLHDRLTGGAPTDEFDTEAVHIGKLHDADKASAVAEFAERIQDKFKLRSDETNHVIHAELIKWNEEHE